MQRAGRTKLAMRAVVRKLQDKLKAEGRAGRVRDWTSSDEEDSDGDGEEDWGALTRKQSAPTVEF